MAYEHLEKTLALAVLDPKFRQELCAKGAEGLNLQLSDRELHVLNCLLDDDAAGLGVILNIVIATSNNAMNAAPSIPLQAFALATPTTAPSGPGWAGAELPANPFTTMPSTPPGGFAAVGVQDIGRLIVARLPFGLDVIQ